MAKRAEPEKFDRRAELEKAQRLVQQNKVLPAIEVYELVVQRDPSDWASANTLGDLLVRARLVDQAIREFTRVAEYLASAGFLARAGGVYKKILRLDPSNVEALRRSDDLNTQRLLQASEDGLSLRALEAARTEPAVTAMVQQTPPKADQTLPVSSSEPVQPARAPREPEPSAVAAPYQEPTPIREPAVAAVPFERPAETLPEPASSTTPPIEKPDPSLASLVAGLDGFAADTNLSDGTDDVRTSSGEASQISYPDEAERSANEAFMTWRTQWLESAAASAGESLERGMLLAEEGHWREAGELFAAAALAPQLRHEAARCAAHARIHDGAPTEAVEWLEWATQVPGRSPTGAWELAYDVAIALETADQPALSLAVLRKLRADTGAGYKDVDTRIARLVALTSEPVSGR